MSVIASSHDLDRPASREERSELTKQLFDAARATTDEAERVEILDRIVLLNRGVAEAVANRYRGRGVREEDLRQAAYEGLVKAVRKFDSAVRPDLLTYAVPTIRGEVQRWFRDQSWMVRPPRRIQELQWRISRSSEQLSQELGRPPSAAEIADSAGCTTAELDEANSARGCFQPASLDRPVLDDGGGSSLGDLLPAEDREQEVAEARIVLEPLMAKLSDRDRRILHLRFVEEQSQGEIGEELGVTQMQVSRLLRRILRDLRNQVEEAA